MDWRRGCVAVGLCGALALVGCGSSTPHSAPLTIGAVWSLTGAAGAYGLATRHGADLAAAQLNAAGGVAGRTLVLDTQDDASTPAGCAAAYARLIDQDKVFAILGPTLTTTALAALPRAQSAGVLDLAATPTAEGITELGSLIFRTALKESVVVPNTVRVTQQRLGYTRVAMIKDEQDAFAQSSSAAFVAALGANGVTIAQSEAIRTGDTDFTAALGRIVAANPQALIVSALANEAIKIVVQARAAGLPANVPIIGGNGFNTPRLAAEAGAAAEGCISGASWIAGASTPGNAAFVTAYTSRFGGAPDQFAAQGYASVYLLAEALKRASALTAPAVAQQLAGLSGVATVLGSVGFDANRNANYTPIVQVVSGGRFQLY